MSLRAPQDMMEAVTETMKERTGRTLDEWVAVVAASGVDPLDQNAVRKWLKTEHGVKQNSQWAIADAAAQAAGWVPPSVEEYIDSQYMGAKASLLPIFDALRPILESLGSDVRVEGRLSAKSRGLSDADIEGKPAEYALPNVLVRLAVDHDRMFNY